MENEAAKATFKLYRGIGGRLVRAVHSRLGESGNTVDELEGQLEDEIPHTAHDLHPMDQQAPQQNDDHQLDDAIPPLNSVEKNVDKK